MTEYQRNDDIAPPAELTIRDEQLKAMGGIVQCGEPDPRSAEEKQRQTIQTVRNSFDGYIAHFKGDFPAAREEFLKQPGLPKDVMKEVADSWIGVSRS